MDLKKVRPVHVGLGLIVLNEIRGLVVVWLAGKGMGWW